MRFMKNSSRLEVKIARNFTRSRSGSAIVHRLRQHATVELEPAQVAIEPLWTVDFRGSLSKRWGGMVHGRLWSQGISVAQRRWAMRKPGRVATQESSFTQSLQVVDVLNLQWLVVLRHHRASHVVLLVA